MYELMYLNLKLQLIYVCKGLETLHLVNDVYNRLLSLHKLFGFKFSIKKKKL